MRRCSRSNRGVVTVLAAENKETPPGLGDRAWHLNPPMGAGELVLQPAANQW